MGSNRWGMGSYEKESGVRSQKLGVRSWNPSPAFVRKTAGKYMYCLKWTEVGEQTFADVSIKGTLTSEELQYSSTSSLFTSRSPSRSCNNTMVIHILSDISDHFSQFCILKSVKDKANVNKFEVRNFSQFSADCFNTELQCYLLK